MSNGRVTISGGLVADSAGELAAGNIHINAGVLAVREPAPLAQTLDATGCIVLPGLVDLHTHVFVGQDAGVHPDPLGAATGVTTMIDAGSAGSALIGAFRRTSIDSVATRVRAFLNVSSIGITSFRLRGELKSIEYCDPKAALDAIEEHRDVIVGVKVRASHDVAADNADLALDGARLLADETRLPLMVHLGPAPASVDGILDRLRRGDILTHCFTGFAGNTVTDPAPRDSVRRAYDRGVIFDIGHGMSGFDSRVAKRMIQEGMPPHTISSDVHAFSMASVGGMPATMSKLLALGMPLDAVIRASTSVPASVVGLANEGVGSLDEGAPADVAVLRLIHTPVELMDGHGNSFMAEQLFQSRATVRAGEIVFDALATTESETRR